MLKVTVPETELYDENNNVFITLKSTDIMIEHSLISLSKWESKWEKPFHKSLQERLTIEQTLDYIKHMTITQNVPDDLYKRIPQKVLNEIFEYIDKPMTATTINRQSNSPVNKEIVTAEIIYYWMVSFNIPFETQKWHLNRLLTLIDVCNLKANPPKKMTREEAMRKNHEMNLARRNQLNSKG